MQMLCAVLSNWLGRPVVDHTGLRDAYNYKIEYTRDPNEPPGPMSGSSVIFRRSFRATWVEAGGDEDVD